MVAVYQHVHTVEIPIIKSQSVHTLSLTGLCSKSFTIPCSDADNWTNNPKGKPHGQRWNNQANNRTLVQRPIGLVKMVCSMRERLSVNDQSQNSVSYAKPKPKALVTKAKTCGFCGGVGHNRRDCPEMQALNKRLIRANNHWRKVCTTTSSRNSVLVRVLWSKSQRVTGHWDAAKYHSCRHCI